MSLRPRPRLLCYLFALLIASACATALAADRWDEIKARGTLEVGLEGTYPPFNFQDANGQLAGFEVDFARLLGKQLGVEVQFQPGKWDGLLAALDSGRSDVVINQVTISEERRKKYDFSAPYSVSGIQLVTLRGNQGGFHSLVDLAGKRIGVVLGSNYEHWLNANAPRTDVRTYDDDPTRDQDLAVGRIDAILVDRLAAFELLGKTAGRLTLAGPPLARQEAGVALTKGNPRLLAAINGAIDQLRRQGELERLSRNWFKADVSQ